MKVTFAWLKEYVDFEWTADALAERLTMLGLEVEGVQQIGGEFQGVVVAQVLTREKHPNADKLSVCRVQDGKGERSIVCGADNFKPGDKVPLILPGASLPLKAGEKEPFTIKVGRIRGVESQGMMCSPQELGLPDDVNGLLILRADARVGQPFAEYLGRAGSDVVYDLEVTPNRPDLTSVIGIARELAALTGNPLRLPEVPVALGPNSMVSDQPAVALESLASVRVAEAALCPRYTARLVRNVKVGPSPDWLRQTLEKVGVRSINNVVDVSNYVMLEIGQPLHTFDYQLLAKKSGGLPTVVVRRAAAGESFATLDGQARRLTPEMLLIADESKAIALAGIMGGQNSEIGAATRDVLIESACFQPGNIRRTSKSLGLRSESSYRFERGVDIGITDWASRRCAQLILQTAGGDLVPGAIDISAARIERPRITLRHARVNQLLGIEVPREQQIKHLTALGLEPIDPASPPDSASAAFAVPTWRVDLKREVDLIEEIARLHGVEKIPSTPPRGAIGANAYDSVQDQLGEARSVLTGLGLSEAQGQTLLAETAARLAVPGERLVLLANPLSSDMNALRPSLLPGLLASLQHNLARQTTDVALFEIGRVFVHSGGQPQEQRRLALAITGRRSAPFWSGEEREAVFDIFDLKGLAEEFLEQFGVRGAAWSRRQESNALFLESAAIALGGKLPLGELGQVLPALARGYDLRDAVFLAELDLDQLLARRNRTKSFKPLPQFPSVRRDVAMLVAETVTHEAVLQAARQARPANLESITLFDIFRGKNIPAGQKSVAYAFIYRSAERTLTDAEVNAAHEKLLAQLKESVQAVVRE